MLVNTWQLYDGVGVRRVYSYDTYVQSLYRIYILQYKFYLQKHIGKLICIACCGIAKRASVARGEVQRGSVIYFGGDDSQILTFGGMNLSHGIGGNNSKFWVDLHGLYLSPPSPSRDLRHCPYGNCCLACFSLV